MLPHLPRTFAARDGYAIAIPFADLDRRDVVPASKIGAAPLAASDRGPASTIRRLGARRELDGRVCGTPGAWAVQSIEVG